MQVEAEGIGLPLDLLVKTADPLHLQIERFLRRQIATGQLAVGTRLPSTAALAARWGVDCKAVQRAVSPLAAEGLLGRCRGRGTFVQGSCRKPMVALILGPSLTNEASHFYRATLEALREATHKRGWTSRTYDGLNPATEEGQPHRQETIRQLESDIRNGGFKGTIHVGLRGEISLAVEHTCGLPVVRDGLMAVYDVQAFIRESTIFLADGGCRRIAMIGRAPDAKLCATPRQEDRSRQETLATTASACGLSQPQVLRMPWVDHAAFNEAETHRRMLGLIDEWHQTPGSMPDGLIVDDDILMRAVALALLARSIAVPRQMRVVTLATDRVRLHYGMPVARYEFSVNGMSETLVDLLWRKVANDTMPDLPIVLSGRLRANEEPRAGDLRGMDPAERHGHLAAVKERMEP
ncbi:MAG: GntR family transcriptional regulator [Kiritimatiellae bacterium]|nr:GntR family transcriptional regulator [Kiritimatiellia bacterium]